MRDNLRVILNFPLILRFGAVVEYAVQLEQYDWRGIERTPINPCVPNTHKNSVSDLMMMKTRELLSTEVGFLNFNQFCVDGLAGERTRDERDREVDGGIARPARGVG